MTLEQTAKVISFPSELRSKRTRKSGGRVRSVDGIKYFNEKQIKMIRRAVRDQAEMDIKKVRSRQSENGWSSICSHAQG